MMTLYSRAADARCHRVRFVLAEKALETRVVETDPAHPPEDLIDLNPYQTVPTLVDRDLVVYEPGIICEYLDERFPHPSMTSTDPGVRAQARVALRRIEQDWYAVADVLEPGSGADRRGAQRQARRGEGRRAARRVARGAAPSTRGGRHTEGLPRRGGRGGRRPGRPRAQA